MCHLFSAATDFHSMSRTFPCLGSFLRSPQSCRPYQPTRLSPAQLRYYTGSTYHNHTNESFSFKSADAQQRWNELRGYKGSLYPRAPSFDNVTRCQDFLDRYEKLKPDEIADDDDVTLCGIPENDNGKAGIAHASRQDTLVSYSRREACFSRHHPG